MFLDYTGIRVTNLPKAVRFYTKGLGLVEKGRGRMGHGGVWVLLEDRWSHQHLELNWYPKGSKYATPFSAGEGLDHLGVRVLNLAAASRRLRKAGARLVSEIRSGGEVALAYFEGPDGVWVELIPTEML
ncbi:MAG TPA: VOC family protein [Thermoplasmata archaeon]|nr:VOC family protein [Thermoplasmata archaeon]